MLFLSFRHKLRPAFFKNLFITERLYFSVHISDNCSIAVAVLIVIKSLMFAAVAFKL